MMMRLMLTLWNLKGNYICFTTGSKNIVLWLHETNKTEKIASSFNDFLKKLY